MRHFYNSYGITGYTITYLFIAAIGALFVAGNEYNSWTCSNYELVTGFEVKYIDWDACYVKGSDGVFIRYDSQYKSVE